MSCGDRNGPGGNLIDLRGAVIDYFEPVLVKSQMRRLFEQNIVRVQGDAPGPGLVVPSTQALQRATQFVRLQVTSMAEINNLDIPGDADLFTRARIGSQRYISGVINSRDSFRFTLPNYPFTFLKSFPFGQTFGTPLTSIRVRIRTGDVRFAGTDDDVYLRISDTRRFALDKRLYDDFERGDNDTYSVPIDGAVEDGLTTGNIRFLQIEKSRDGVAGGWRLGGASIWVNDRPVYSNDRIDRWLENNSREFRAPRFTALPATGREAPVFLQLWEQDAPIRGDHDHTDINSLDRRQDTALAYAPGAPLRTGDAVGGSAFGGRLGDGERARLSWKLQTFFPSVATIAPARRGPGSPICASRLQPQRVHGDELRHRAGGPLPGVGGLRRQLQLPGPGARPVDHPAGGAGLPRRRRLQRDRGLGGPGRRAGRGQQLAVVRPHHLLSTGERLARRGRGSGRRERLPRPGLLKLSEPISTSGRPRAGRSARAPPRL